MNLSEDLIWRGLIKDHTFSDLSWLDEPKAFYLGIDASADSLTVGNLAIILLAKRLTDAGWQAYLIMGGGTSLVGDPGGKTEERQLMSREAIVNNIAKVKDQVKTLFRGEKFTMLDNYDWLANLKYLDFLREVGKRFSMTELMQRDFVTERMGKLGSGISYAEFSYSLVQGYDFWHLFNANGVVLQIGGSDQWGNLLSGVALIRKKEAKEAQALSMPLIINKTTGVKFGKTEGEAVWLDKTKTTPNQFYQFWINVGDEWVEDYLKVYTTFTKAEIENIMSEFKQAKSNRLAQRKLAEAVTILVHGDQAATEAKIHAENLKVNITELTANNEDLRVYDSLSSSIIDALTTSNLANSKSEARQLIESGGVYVNDQQTNKLDFEVTDYHNGMVKLRKGKTLQNTVLIKQPNGK